MIITSGKNKSATGLIPYLVINSATKITINVSNILINILVTYEIGRTNLGKYIFFIKFSWLTTQADPLATEIPKKFHGINPTNKKIEKCSIPDLRIYEKTIV